MPDSTISGATPASALDGTEEMAGSQGGLDRAISAAQILTYIESAIGTAAFRALIDDATTGDLRTTLGLAIGSNVQAYSANLTTFAGIAPSANVQSVLGAADYAAIRTLLGLVIGTNVQAYSAVLAAISGATPIADGPHTVGANTITTVGGIITAIT